MFGRQSRSWELTTQYVCHQYLEIEATANLMLQRAFAREVWAKVAEASNLAAPASSRHLGLVLGTSRKSRPVSVTLTSQSGGHHDPNLGHPKIMEQDCSRRLQRMPTKLWSGSKKYLPMNNRSLLAFRMSSRHYIVQITGPMMSCNLNSLQAYADIHEELRISWSSKMNFPATPPSVYEQQPNANTTYLDADPEHIRTPAKNQSSVYSTDILPSTQTTLFISNVTQIKMESM